MYYTPSPTEAYASITHLTNDVFMGEFVRGMHKWGASVMIILIFLHMARTFFFGAYKYPRELNWVIGVVLIVLTLVMGLTGLPAAVRPALLLGDDRRHEHQRHRPDRRALPGRLPTGRGRVRGTTLSRFYALHMMLVPGAIIALIGAHLYLVVKLGTTAPPWVRAESTKPKALREEKV